MPPRQLEGASARAIMKLAARRVELESISTGSLGIDHRARHRRLPRAASSRLRSGGKARASPASLHVIASQTKAAPTAPSRTPQQLDPGYAKKLGVDLGKTSSSPARTPASRLEIADTAGALGRR